MNKKQIFLFVLLALCTLNLSAQKIDKSFAKLCEYIELYTNPNFPNLKTIKVEDIITNNNEKHLTIVLSDNFIAQPLTPLVVGDLPRQSLVVVPSVTTLQIPLVPEGKVYERTMQ